MFKKLLIGLMVVLSLFLTFSCGPAKKKPIQLMIWGRTEEYRAVVGFVKKFNTIYPDIKVQILFFPNYQTKLLTMMSAGTPPDVMYMGSEDFPFYANKDVFLDLTPMIQNDPDTVTPKFNIKDFYPQTVEPFIHQGKILGLPKDFSTMVLYYNKTMFDSAGVAYPTDNWTWNDFLEACKKLTKKDADTGRMQYVYVFL
jgi:multiple sugar transport system substrate-binding protein